MVVVESIIKHFLWKLLSQLYKTFSMAAVESNIKHFLWHLWFIIPYQINFSEFRKNTWHPESILLRLYIIKGSQYNSGGWSLTLITKHLLQPKWLTSYFLLLRLLNTLEFSIYVCSFLSCTCYKSLRSNCWIWLE